jgi:hypothetical protein
MNVHQVNGTGRVLRLRGAPIIHDTIDNETIAINQQTGRYYSLEGPAAAAWQELETGATAAILVDHLANRYDADPVALRGQVESFLSDLLGEGLIVEDGVSAASSGTAPATGAMAAAAPSEAEVGSSASASADGAPLSGLALHRYTDMEVLLLADPIHDVDETGWPSPQPEATG